MARRKIPQILWIVAVILVLLWLVGVLTKVAGGIIHILLVIALLLVIYRLATGKRVL